MVEKKVQDNIVLLHKPLEMMAFGSKVSDCLVFAAKELISCGSVMLSKVNLWKTEDHL